MVGTVDHARSRSHDLGAVDVRQLEVDDDEIDRLQGGGADALGAGGRFLHGEALELEPGAQEAADLHLVVDDERDEAGPIHRRSPSDRPRRAAAPAGAW